MGNTRIDDLRVATQWRY